MSDPGCKAAAKARAKGDAAETRSTGGRGPGWYGVIRSAVLSWQGHGALFPLDPAVEADGEWRGSFPVLYYAAYICFEADRIRRCVRFEDRDPDPAGG